MNFVLDTHTHTTASGHAYSSLEEIISAAHKKHFTLLAVTDHGPAMVGASCRAYFRNFHVVPREWDGLKLMMGAEANILTSKGDMDLDDEVFERVDLVIASMHTSSLKAAGMAADTDALLGAMENPYVDIIGHPDNVFYEIDYEVVVRRAAERQVPLEVNNSSLTPGGFRKYGGENAGKFLRLCKRYGAYVTLGSDAHISTDVGNFAGCLKVLKENDFPEELVLNTSAEKFLSYLQESRMRRGVRLHPAYLDMQL